MAEDPLERYRELGFSVRFVSFTGKKDLVAELLFHHDEWGEIFLQDGQFCIHLYDVELKAKFDTVMGFLEAVKKEYFADRSSPS